MVLDIYITFTKFNLHHNLPKTVALTAACQLGNDSKYLKFSLH